MLEQFKNGFLVVQNRDFGYNSIKSNSINFAKVREKLASFVLL